MTKWPKLARKEVLKPVVARLQQRPKDFTWDELAALLNYLGYKQAKPGKIGGSRRRFVHPTAPTITLHKPHTKNILKMYIIDDVLEVLKQEGML